MAEPITIQLSAAGPLTGVGLIDLGREAFASSAGGRLRTATIPAGSRVAADVFGFLGEGGVKSVTVWLEYDDGSADKQDYKRKKILSR